MVMTGIAAVVLGGFIVFGIIMYAVRLSHGESFKELDERIAARPEPEPTTHRDASPGRTGLRALLYVLVGAIALVAFCSFTMSIVTLPPQQYLEEGRTVLMWRQDGLRLIDSPQAMTMRFVADIEALPADERALATVLEQPEQLDETRIIADFPFWEWAYRRSLSDALAYSME